MVSMHYFSMYCNLIPMDGLPGLALFWTSMPKYIEPDPGQAGTKQGSQIILAPKYENKRYEPKICNHPLAESVSFSDS